MTQTVYPNCVTPRCVYLHIPRG